MRDEVIYRCVNHSCARSLPRRVKYCPYCGIDQVTAMPRPSPPRAGSAQQVWGLDQTAPHAAPTATAHPQTAAPRTEAPPAQRERAAAGAAFNAGTAASASAGAAPSAASPPPSPPGVKPTGASAAAAAGPPHARPIRLRWIVLALAALWIAWLTQRPPAPESDKGVAARVDRAVAMAAACKANEAQAELIALKNQATPAQLARVQAALDDADLSCRKAGRAKAAGRAAPRTGAPPDQPARKLLLEARSAMTQGDYRAAADKMEVCIAMVEADTRDCSALKARAERLDGDQRRCLARGAEWVKDGCQ
ncbi:MAG: hypothetical protein ACJ8HI_21415 [Massilia sp.]